MTERNPEPIEPSKINPSIHPAPHQRYNPKREANAQNRNESTGLDEDFDEDPLEEEDPRDEEFRDQSGAI